MITYSIERKCFSSRPLSSSPLLTDALKSHNPWGRPGLCRRGIIQVWGIMTPLSLSGSLQKLLLGPVSSGPSTLDGYINGDPSLTITRCLISLLPPSALFSLIIPHCGSHKKRETYLIFTWGHFLGVDSSFFSLFFTNGSQLCFPSSVVLSSFSLSLSQAHTLTISHSSLSVVRWDNRLQLWTAF